jgi:hypothetical protein
MVEQQLNETVGWGSIPFLIKVKAFPCYKLKRPNAWLAREPSARCARKANWVSYESSAVRSVALILRNKIGGVAYSIKSGYL